MVAGHKGHPEAVKKTRMASLTGDVWECTKIHQFFPNLTIFEDLLRSEVVQNVWKSAAVRKILGKIIGVSSSFGERRTDTNNERFRRKKN